MELTTATVVVHAKTRRPPISATTNGRTVETTRSDSAWIATRPASMTETGAFGLVNSASQPTIGSGAILTGGGVSRLPLAAMAARVSQLQPRIRLDWLPAHENFTRSTASDDSPGFSLIASRQPH
jgi:hypothetical protein